MRVCIICPVRKGTPKAVFHHVVKLEENEDNSVFFPPRDILKTTPESDICQRMLLELDLADEVHVYYSPDSQGVHFDMGMLFVLQGELPRKVKWLNPSKSKALDGYEMVLKEMCNE